MSKRIRLPGHAPNCRSRDDCRAKGAGHCRSCNLSKLHADPEFAAANAERMRKLHADRLVKKLEELDELALRCFHHGVAEELLVSTALVLARDDMAIRRRVRMRGSTVLT